jgi:glycosyltransferase involved in cell wall biosynthesis
MVSLTRTGLLRDTAFIVLARLAGRRVVAHVHGSDLEQIRRRSLRGAALRLVGRMSSECVAIAPSLAGRLGELGVRASAILNPVRVHPDRDAPRAEEAGGAFRLLFVGTYGARKGCPELVRALALAREQGADVSLTFAGKEERHGEEAHLRGLVDELQLDGAVSFAGVVAAKDLPILYRAASAFCLPSYREGLPMALLEAMAAGLPSITCAVGGIGDVVVDGDSGLLVPSGDVDRLAAAIVVLASDEDRRRQMGESARDRVYRVAGDAHVAMQWHELYARLHLPERDAAVYP